MDSDNPPPSVSSNTKRNYKRSLKPDGDQYESDEEKLLSPKKAYVLHCIDICLLTHNRLN
jgi:hypothetical protein